jgi:hypothetical protein
VSQLADDNVWADLLAFRQLIAGSQMRFGFEQSQNTFGPSFIGTARRGDKAPTLFRRKAEGLMKNSFDGVLECHDTCAVRLRASRARRASGLRQVVGNECFRVSPFPVGSILRNAQRSGDLAQVLILDTLPDEHVMRNGIIFLKRFESLIEQIQLFAHLKRCGGIQCGTRSEQIESTGIGRNLKFHIPRPRMAVTYGVHDCPIHKPRGNGEKLATVFPFEISLTGEPHECFIHNLCRLEALSGRVRCKARICDFPERSINKREKLLA